IPVVGPGIYGGVEHIRDTIKYAVVQGAIFEELGFNYYGPVNGHNIHDLIEALTLAKNIEEPVLVHVLTKKGKGYRNAELHPSQFHGIGSFDKELGSVLNKDTRPTYSKVFGNKMIELAEKNKDIVAVCAAMEAGTGLEKFAKTYPQRFFDGCIAEAHTVSFAAGLAANGLRPVVAIYSTFLQRAYDQILIDVALQNLPVIFAIDRGGIVGADGETHHGVFDLSYLSHMPNMTILVPKDGQELEDMMDYALQLPGPCAIRYPRGHAEEGNSVFEPKCQVIEKSGHIAIIAIGNMVHIGQQVCQLLGEKGITAGLINGRMVKPLDTGGIESAISTSKVIVTLEDNVVHGGFGEMVAQELIKNDFLRDKTMLNIGWPDQFIEHGSIDQLFQKYKMDAMGIVERICEFIERKA
ncbi:MAG: transketolase C-terminal domain-containing protein, partial [Anaerovorax sp.]